MSALKRAFQIQSTRRSSRGRRRPLRLESLENRCLLSSVRLDAPQALAGDLGQFDVSADGQFGVYLADATTDHQNELYSVEFASGETRKLSLEIDGSVLDFVVSPDTRHVVYRSQQPTGPIELFGVAITGGEPTRLNGTLVDGGNVEPERYSNSRSSVLPYRVSPNSHRVVYIADQEIDNDFELFSVPIQGGTATRLNDRPPRFEGIETAFLISPDSKRVVYWADQRPDTFYSVPLAGGLPTKLAESYPREFEISPDSRHVVFWSNDGLESIPIEGGESTVLSGFSANSTEIGVLSVDPDNIQISPDGHRVVFRLGGKFGRKDIYSVGINGSGLVHISEVLGHDPLERGGFQITADSRHVVFVAHVNSSRSGDALYRSSIFGGPRKSLSNTIGPVTTDVLTDFQISPGGSYVVYREGSGRDGRRLFSAPLSGNRQFRLDIPTEGDAPIDEFHISADGKWVTYSERTWETVKIYSVPLWGGDSAKLNGELAARGSVSGFLVSPDSGRVVYRAHQDTAGVAELYSVPLAGGNSTRLNVPLTALGDSVAEIELSPAGDFVVYRADHDTDDVLELYSVEVATGVVTKLNETLTGFRQVLAGFRISQDGSQVVYRAGEDPIGTIDLYSVPIAGGDSTRLSSDLAEQTRDFKIAADGGLVVFVADPIDAFQQEVYSVPITGGEVTQLSRSNRGNGRIYDFQVSGDSSRVVFTADDVRSARPDLFSVPILGGNIVQLNGDDREDVQRLSTSDLVELGIAHKELADEALDDITVSTPKPGRVGTFQISPDGQYVVYKADQDFNNTLDLYSVPVAGGEFTKLAESIASFQISSDSRNVVMYDQLRYDKSELLSVPIGGGSVTRLSPALGAVSSEFALSPDGKWVAFVGTEEHRGTLPLRSGTLYGVPITGGEPIQLNDTANHRATVRLDIQFAPDSSRVAYRTNQTKWWLDELRSVPITGGESVRHSAPVHDVAEEFVIGSDGGTVLYLTEHAANGGLELYSAPLLGGDVRQLNGPLVVGGSVTSHFALSANCADAIYVADQDIDEQFGIYRTEVPLASGFTVTSLIPDSSGFTIQFSTALNTDVLNIFDTESATLGPADLMLAGEATGIVRGSFIVDNSQRSGKFIKSGGPLVTDTYTVSLRTGGNSFKSNQGVWLGAADNRRAHDFSASLAISETSRVVSLPDFARGPGQDVNIPVNTSNGIPLSISEGAGLRNATIEVRYDPSLLSITAATLGAAMPDGATVSLDTSTAGAAVLTFSSPADLPAGNQVLVNLRATVPSDVVGESYGRPHILQIDNIELTDTADISLPAVGDHALHVASFFGDVTGNGRIDTLDASKIARVAAEIDTGFAATPLVDPWITADLTGNGVVNGSDALRLLQLLLQPTTSDTSTPQTFSAANASPHGQEGQFRLNLPNTATTDHAEMTPGRMTDTSHRRVDAAMSAVGSDREDDEGRELLEVGLEAAVDELLAVPGWGRSSGLRKRPARVSPIS